MFSMRPRKANCSSFCVMLLPLPSSDMLVFILSGNKKQGSFIKCNFHYHLKWNKRGHRIPYGTGGNDTAL
jgi:hypothetical protein